MASITVSPLRDDLPFGARITGLTRQALADDAVAARIRDIFEERGVLVFEDVEQTAEMQVAISRVIGPLKEHPLRAVKRVDADARPGVIQLKADPDYAMVEIGKRRLVTWQPWHFDHSYHKELNRAGVLRPVQLPPADGETGFVDGIQLYRDFPPELLEQIEGSHILYTLDLRYSRMRFGRSEDFVLLVDQPELDEWRELPRAVHPAVWTRASGEKVLHLSPWGAVGIQGREDPDGDALFEAVCQEIPRRAQPYNHAWKPTDMVAWDNWRILHGGCGCDPAHDRVLHRTTIEGDYGLGRWESPIP